MCSNRTYKSIVLTKMHHKFHNIHIHTVCRTDCAWPYLSDSRVSSSHLTRAVGLLLMGHFNTGGPLVKETIGGVEATVSHARLSLEVLTHPIAIIVVTHAWLLCRSTDNGKKLQFQINHSVCFTCTQMTFFSKVRIRYSENISGSYSTSPHFVSMMCFTHFLTFTSHSPFSHLFLYNMYTPLSSGIPFLTLSLSIILDGKEGEDQIKKG